MKKRIFKVIAGATLLVAMAVGFQMNKVQTKSALMLEGLGSIAMAGDGEVPWDLNCDNGCVGGSGGCWCYVQYDEYAEYDGWD